MTWVEYKEWQRFYVEEPWGCEVEDYRATLIINSIRASIAGSDPLSMQQLFPRGLQDLNAPVNDNTLSERLRVAFETHNAIVAVKQGQSPEEGPES